VAFQNVVSLKNSSGQTFSNWEKYPDSSIDPEEMRYNPKNQISGMEQRRRKSHSKDFTVMQNPSLQFAALNGDYGSAFELPSQPQYAENREGPRSNGVLEGLTFNKDYSALY
jgi:hypothetical protein